MPTWCAWCDPQRVISESPEGIETHGICRKHYTELWLDIIKHGHIPSKQDIKFMTQFYVDLLRGEVKIELPDE